MGYIDIVDEFANFLMKTRPRFSKDEVCIV